MSHLFFVMLGGAIGSNARHLVDGATLELWGPDFPWGTLVINIVGGLAMGALVAWLATRASGDEALRHLLGVGLLGGFTTFSAFSLDTMLLLQRGEHGAAALYILVSVAGAIVTLFAGMQITRALA